MTLAVTGWRILSRAALYFALVFATGFLLGPIRVLWLAPRVGERVAELIEAPLMLGAITLASCWMARRCCVGWSGGPLFVVGLLAATGVLAADLAVGVVLRGMSVTQVLFERDPVAGSVYYALVLAMALAPWAWRRRAGRRES